MQETLMYCKHVMMCGVKHALISMLNMSLNAAFTFACIPVVLDANADGDGLCVFCRRR